MSYISTSNITCMDDQEPMNVQEPKPQERTVEITITDADGNPVDRDTN